MRENKLLQEAARRIKSSPSLPEAKTKPEIRLPLPVPSVEQVRWRMILEPKRLKTDEKKFLASLSQVSEQDREVSRLSRESVEIIRRKDEDELLVWLDRAHNSQVKEMRGFAFGIMKDESAVRQAVRSQWGNGQAEVRLKMANCPKSWTDPEEYAAGHAPQAALFPLDALEKDLFQTR